MSGGALPAGPAAWCDAWVEAREQGPKAYEEMQHLLGWVKARKALRDLETDRAVARQAEANRCTWCRAPLPSLVRTVCPPCTHRRGVR